MFKCVLNLSALLLGVGAANAGLIPTDLAVNKEGDSGAYRFTYSVDLQSKGVLQPGDFFTIYDFAGRVDGTELQPANFHFSSATSGPTPAQVTAKDDPAVSNLTWTYTGTGPITGDAFLGEFSAVSTYRNTRSDDFTGQSHKQDVGGHFNNNITDTVVPVPSCVPEPPAWMLAAVAAAGLAGYGWRRRAGKAGGLV